MAREVTDPMQALLAKEASIKADILNPRATEVDPAGFTMQQLGLQYPLVGKDGRMWAQDSDEPYHLRVIYDPNKKD